MAVRAKHGRKRAIAPRGPRRGPCAMFSDEMVDTYALSAPLDKVAEELGMTKADVAAAIEGLCRKTFPVGGYNVPILQPNPGIVDGVAHFQVNTYALA